MAGANATLPATLGALQNELLLNSLPGATDVNTGKLAGWLLEGPLPPSRRRQPPLPPPPDLLPFT